MANEVLPVYKASEITTENQNEQNQAQMSQCTYYFMFNKYLTEIWIKDTPADNPNQRQKIDRLNIGQTNRTIVQKTKD